MINVPLASQSGSATWQPPAHPVGGDELLLVAEDDACVRSLLCTLLAGHGYTVLQAMNGEEALEIAKRHCQAIALLLTDVVMPWMGGRELAERLSLVQPQARVLFMSGYGDEIFLRHDFRLKEVDFMQKPFTMRTLLYTVRHLLDGPEPRDQRQGSRPPLLAPQK
jgi:CheY-like chemotaxis protein